MRQRGLYRPLKAFLTIAIVLVGTLTFLSGALADPSTTATIVASSVDQFGTPVRGNCFTIQATGFSQTRCDGADGSVDGSAAFADLALRTYTVRQSYTPIGYAPPALNLHEVTLDTGGAIVPVSFTSSRTDLQITLVDGNGQPVIGACFNVLQGSYSRTVCDSRETPGGNNGVTLLDYVPTGAVTLTQTNGPSTHTVADPRLVSITAGTVNVLEIEVDAIPRVDVTVRSEDQFGTPARGACFRLARGLYNVIDCDSFDLVADGTAVFENVPALSGYTVTQIYTPIGNAAPDSPAASLDVTESGPNAVTFTSNRTDLEVTVRDWEGNLVSGACIRVTFANYARTMCDGLANSGGLNGVTLVTFTPAPSVNVTMSIVPPGYGTPPVQSLTITPGAVNTLEIVLQPPAPELSATFTAIDAQGDPLFEADQGDTVTFVATVRNTGNALATGVTVTDDLGNTYICDRTNLSPNDLAAGGLDEARCEADYMVTGADRAAGTVSNGAVVDADFSDTALETESFSFDVRAAGGSVISSAFRGSGAAIDPVTETVARGETITFFYAVENTGASQLTGVSLTSSIAGTISCDSGDLADGTLLSGESGICTGSYTVTEADRVARSLTDTVTISADQIDAPAPTSSITLSVSETTLSISGLVFSDLAETVQVAPGAKLNEGQEYYIRATIVNVTFETLTNVVLTVDTAASVPTECTAAALDPGGSLSCTAAHQVSSTEATAGQVVIDAAVSATELATPVTGVVADMPANQRPVAATNPVNLMVSTNSGDLPASIFTMFGVSDPESDAVGVVEVIPAADGSTLDIDSMTGIGTFTLVDNVDTVVEVVVADVHGAVLSLSLEIDADTDAPSLSTFMDVVELEAGGPDGAFLPELVSVLDDRDPEPLVSCALTGGAFAEPGDLLALGSYQVTCEASDSAGNVSLQVAIQVHVVDTTPPVLDESTFTLALAEASEIGGGSIGYTPPGASDAVDVDVIVACSPEPFAFFSLGSNPVTCTAEDDSGNTATAHYQVVVDDTTPPDVTIEPGYQEVEADPFTGEAFVSFTVIAGDIVDDNLDIVCDRDPSGDFYAVGSHFVTCQASDDSGNSATSNTIQIEVLAPPE